MTIPIPDDVIERAARTLHDKIVVGGVSYVQDAIMGRPREQWI